MIMKKDLENVRELIQDDLICVLDGLEDEVIDKVCEVVVERMNFLIGKVDKE